MGETREPADLIARCYLGDLFFPEYASRFRLEFINFLHRQLENRISNSLLSPTRAPTITSASFSILETNEVN